MKRIKIKIYKYEGKNKKKEQLCILLKIEFNNNFFLCKLLRAITCRIPKQVCYRDIVRKYGTKHWDYPDVNCPKCL